MLWTFLGCTDTRIVNVCSKGILQRQARSMLTTHVYYIINVYSCLSWKERLDCSWSSRESRPSFQHSWAVWPYSTPHIGHMGAGHLPVSKVVMMLTHHDVYVRTDLCFEPALFPVLVIERDHLSKCHLTLIPLNAKTWWRERPKVHTLLFVSPLLLWLPLVAQVVHCYTWAHYIGCTCDEIQNCLCVQDFSAC